VIRRWSVRVRIALICGGAIAAVGVAVLALTFLLLHHVITTEPVDLVPSQRQALEHLGPSSDPAQAAALKTQINRDQEELRTTFHERTVNALARDSLLTLALLSVAAAGTGWVASVRVLAPFARITRTVQRRARGGPRERLVTAGPPDELRDLAETLEDLLARLDAAVEGQWRFVANASHELKTPLAINRTLLEVALGRPEASPELTQLGGTLLEVNARHERLIDGLLTLARSEHAAFRPVALDLADVARRVTDQARAEAGRVGVRITRDLVAAPLLGDPVLLERLTLNLVQNAIRHNRPEGWAKVSTTTTSETVVLIVENSGPEVAEYEIPGLFEPFRQQEGRTSSVAGSGLGLSIVRSVARAHGGEVSGVPLPAGGLRVQVVLPAPVGGHADDGRGRDDG